jgi:hypothetical protein
MTAFAIVRDKSDLPLACHALGSLLSMHVGENHPVDSLLGIWVEPTLADHPPTALSGMDSTPGARIPIHETTGLGSVWTLCRMDNDTGVTRVGLLKGLIAVSPAADSERFIPVFDARMSRRQVGTEMEQLQDAGTNELLRPLQQTVEGRRVMLRAAEGLAAAI